MSKSDKQDRIDAYLLGRAPAGQRREFEEEVSRDPDLGADLAATELALAAIEMGEDQALKSRLQGLERSLAGQSASPAARVVTLKPPRRNRLRYLAYAATLLLLLAVGWWALQPRFLASPEQVAMAEFSPYPNIAYQLERGSAADDAERSAFLAYEDGNFPEAVSAFSRLAPTPVRQFYYGQSLLGTEAFAEAETVFRELTAADFNLSAEAEYYLALAQVGQGKAGEARALLEEIIAQPDHPSREAAEALHAKL